MTNFNYEGRLNFDQYGAVGRGEFKISDRGINRSTSATKETERFLIFIKKN